MKKQMKTNLFTAALGLGLIGVMVSSSRNEGTATTASQVPNWPGLQAPNIAAANANIEPTSIPFTVYLSLITSFTNGQPINFNMVNEEGQSSILDKITNWREEQ
jgi:hypothetical protein